MKKLLMFLLLGIFLFSLASVSALQFDNIKQIKEIGKTNYPNIEIKNAFGLGQRLARIELEEHQETCGQFCDSIMLITLDEDSVLIDDAWTLKKENGEWIKRDIRKLEFYINTEDKFIDVDDYETQCEVTGRSKNGTEIENCQRVKVGSHKEDAPTWTKYNLGEEVKKGIYEVQVRGEKKPSWEVDWIIETQGKILDELAVWNGIETVYDEIDDSSIDLNLWNHTVINDNSGATPTFTWTENNDFMTYYNYLPGVAGVDYSRYRQTELRAYNLLNLSLIDSMRFRLKGVSNGNGDGLGSLTLNVFGNNVATITNDDSVWTIIKNTSAGENYFDVYNDDVYSSTILASHNNISISSYIRRAQNPYQTNLSVYYMYYNKTNIVLNSPADDSISDTNNVQFNATATVTGGATLVNMSLWTNESGDWELRNSSSISPRLVSHYPFEGSLEDTAGSNDLTDSGTSDTTGIIGNARLFEESNSDYAYDDSFAGLVTGSSDRTVCTWIYPTTVNSDPKSILSYGAEGDNQLFRMMIGSDNKFAFNGYISNDFSSTTTASADNWYHFCIVVDESNSKILMYINGVNENNQSGTLNTASSTLSLGRYILNIEYFDGKIDEVSYWNRTLSSTEISNYYAHSGSELLPRPEVTQTFNRTITEDIIWNVQACDSDGDCGFAPANYTLSIDTTSAIISGIEGNGTLDYGALTINKSLNFTATDSNLDTCWIDYNNTNTTYSCSSGVKVETNFTLQSGVYNATIYANDSVGNLGSQFVEWDYNVFQNSFNYSNETRAGDQEDFTLNITLGVGYDLTSATLYYGNLTESPGIFASGQERIITVTDYSVPLYTTDTNVSLYFHLVLDDATELNTTNVTQLVQAIFLDNCSSYTNKLFNISLFDETSKESINGDIEFNYKLLNKPSYEEINQLNLSFTNVSTVGICSDINLIGQNYAQSIEIRYSSSYNNASYVPELYHIQRADIGDAEQKLNLYDLNSSSSTEFKVTYQDSTFNFVEGAIIQLQRKYIAEDNYEVVEAPLTSNGGVSVLHIDLNGVKYKATVVKDGEVLDTFDNLVFVCESELTGDCEQQLLGEINPQNEVDLDTGRDFAYSLAESNGTITTTFSVPSGSSSSINIILTQTDQFGNETLCNRTITSSAGSIDCDYSTTIGDSYLDLYIYKSGEPIGRKSYLIAEDSGLDFLGNNFFIVFVLLLSLTGMAFSSPEWIVMNGLVTMVIAGALFLVSGLNFVIGLGGLLWLVVTAGLLIFKMAKQEDR